MTEMQIKLNSVNDVRDFVEFAMKHTEDITLESGRHKVDAKSIMGVFSLDLSKPITLIIEGTMPTDVYEGIRQFEVSE